MGDGMLKIISWNINQKKDAWRHLLSTDADIALVQEARRPPKDVLPSITVDAAPWGTAGLGLSRPWRTAVVKLSDQVEVDWFEQRELHEGARGDFAVSRLGTLSVARVTSPSCPPLLVASMYAPWEEPHDSVARPRIYADASVHRVISDLSVFIGQTDSHRIIAAGDLNILHGYGERGSEFWASRYATVFDRFAALGLRFIGPQFSDGRQADPWPDELPRESQNVVTYRTIKQTPETATRQLDFVFASDALAGNVSCRALNPADPDAWGPSDHCMIEINVE
jgi:exonuclease III